MKKPSKAHAELLRRHACGQLVMSTVARRIGMAPTSLRYVMQGAEPRVGLAIALQRELGIPLTDWTIPAVDFSGAIAS